MKFSAVFASSLVVGLLGFSASASDGEQGVPASNELTLDSLMAELSTARGVVARFRERKEISLLVAPLESRGVLYFAPPARLARFTLAPSYSSLIIDGGTLRFRDREAGEQFDLSGNPIARMFVDNFIVLFNGDVGRLRELYDTEFSTEGHDWSLRLTPRSQRLRVAVESIVLTGGSGTGGRGGIRRMVLHGADGDRTTTDLETQEADRLFTDAELEMLFSEGAPLPTEADTL